MKKILVAAILAAVLSIAHSGNVHAGVRYANGIYHDYMSITTTDGNEWLLSDAQKARNPYMKRRTVRLNGRKVQIYMPIFRNGEKVRVKFDTRGTKNKKDDRIISVQKRGK